MKRLDFYIASTVASTIFLASFSLVGVLGIFTLLEQVEDLENNYQMIDATLYVLYSAPRLFYETSPVAAMIGCLAGLGILANNSELLVMRASGVSVLSISWSAIKPALVLVFIGLYVGEYILPDLERTARVNKNQALTSEDESGPNEGFWYREGDVYMHFNEVVEGGILEGVTHYTFDENHKLLSSLYAKRAVYHDLREGEQYWLFKDVQITRISQQQTSVEKLTSQRWDTVLNPQLISTEILVQPNKMSIGELDAKITYMQAQGLDSGKFELGFWSKIFQPLGTIALVFIAISFVFGPLREATMGMRVVMGLVVGLVFKFIQDLLGPASLVFGFSPILAVLFPILICFVVSFFLFRRSV
ncbi:MAG: LPS export ABC transporter permease LptG [Pseudomonadales bacterium]|nr:LPS export ABC transporter permease LptG [Pseudomonadales bacterium]